MGLQQNLAVYMKETMRRENKSLSEYAEELGISRNSLYEYTTGEGNPTISMLEHMAKRMGVNPAALIGKPNEDPSAVCRLLLETIQSVAELPKERRLRFAELFLEMVKLWNES